MQPTLFPQGGSPIDGTQHVLRILKRVASQVSANARIDVTGDLMADEGHTGVRIAMAQQPKIECFEIQTCWRVRNARHDGATLGRYWYCEATPVQYWHRDRCDSFWRGHKKPCTDPPQRVRIWWPVTAPERELTWQRALYPLHGIGQWVWCIWDYSADVWRVLHGYDDLVRFRLVDSLEAGGSARAAVVGYTCCEEQRVSSSSSCPPSQGAASESSASSSEPSSVSSSFASSSVGSSSVASSSSSAPSSVPPSLGSSCSAGFSQSASASQPSGSESSGSASSGSEEAGSSESSSFGSCFRRTVGRARVVVHDTMGVVGLLFSVGCAAPACVQGWAKRCPDSGRFEVVSLGRIECAGSASSGGPLGTLLSRLADLEQWRDFYKSCLRRTCGVPSSAGSGEVASSSSGSQCITPESVGLPACPGEGKHALICNNGCLEWMPINPCNGSSAS